MSNANEETTVDWDSQKPTTNNDFTDPLSLEDDDEPITLSPQVLPNKTHYVNVDTTDDLDVVIEDTKSAADTESSLNITVSDPKKEVENSIYISYLVTSDKNQVRRRFQDFVWLHTMLFINYPACFVPPLPDKHLLGYVKGDRFSPEFTEKRRICLERFLHRVANHPSLRKSSALTTFLASSEFNDESARALRENVIDTISDSLLNVFSKIRNPDPRFLDMQDKYNRTESHLNILQKTVLRTNKRVTELQHDYKELSQSAYTLSTIDPSYKVIIDNFANTLDEYTDSINQVLKEDTKWQLEIYDYLSYCRSIKEVLKLRDQKQLDFEDLSEYLKSATVERQDTLHGRLGEGGVLAYITEKLLEFTGSNPNRARRARIGRLDEQIRELEEAVRQTRQISTDFSQQVLKEDILFNKSKDNEIYHAMKSFTNAKVDFYQKSLDIWEDFLQKLENNNVPTK